MLRKYIFKLSLPNNPISLEIPTTSLINNIADSIKEKGYKQVSFMSVDGIKFSMTTKVSEISNEPYIVHVDDHQYKINPLIEDELQEIYDRFFINLNQNPVDRQLLEKYVHSVSSYLHLSSQSCSKHLVMEALQKFLPKGNTKPDNTHDVIHKLNEYHPELMKLIELDERLDLKASRFTNGVFWMGFGVLAFQFSYIGAGTYVYYSWDIMEPQAYLIGLGNLIVGYGAYAAKRQVFSLTSVYETVKERRKRQLSKNYKLDKERLQFLKAEVEKLKMRLVSD